MSFHEIHLTCTARSRKLARLKRALPDLRPNLQCDPANIPANTLCYEYPSGREQEFEAAAAIEGLAYVWGISGFSWSRSFVVGDYLYAIRPNALAIWNIQDPENPGSPIGAVGFLDTPIALFLYDSVAYVTLLNGDLVQVNVDDPTNPTIDTDTTLENSGEIFTQLFVIGATIIAAGSSISIFTTTSDAEPPVLIVNFANPGGDVAQIDVQGRRLFWGDAAAGDCELRSYRIGGFFCPWITTGALAADEVKAEAIKARHGYFYGEVVASSIGAGGGTGETESGVVYAANYMKNGSKFWFWSDSVVDPNTLFTATPGSIFSASDGSVWRNTDGASAWTAM